MAQSVARILGKDEVTGSNPVSSSNGNGFIPFPFFSKRRETLINKGLSAFLIETEIG